jgi:hypothetical protein
LGAVWLRAVIPSVPAAALPVLHAIIYVHSIVTVENVAYLVRMALVCVNGYQNVATANTLCVVLCILLRDSGLCEGADKSAGCCANTCARECGSDRSGRKDRSNDRNREGSGGAQQKTADSAYGGTDSRIRDDI